MSSKTDIKSSEIKILSPKQEKLLRSQTRQLFLIDARIKVALYSPDACQLITPLVYASE